MNSMQTFDSVWERKYFSGHEQRAPWDSVVSFVERHRPQNKARTQTAIMEVGCGTASNLWFLASEGFDTAGLDASRSAISTAKTRFTENGLQCDLRVGDFTRLPYTDQKFDLIIDRAALTCCGKSGQRQAIAEIHRCAKKGAFLFTPYADTHTSAEDAEMGEDDVCVNITLGTLVGVGQIAFLSENEIYDLFPEHSWRFRELEYLESKNMLDENGSIHSSWRVIVEKL